MTLLRRFNDNGLVKFSESLDELRRGDKEIIDLEVESSHYTSIVEPYANIESFTFKNRYEAAEYLYHILSKSGTLYADNDKFVWSWLSLYYFNQLCPVNSKGIQMPGEDARYMLNISSRRYYRHLLAGAYKIYKYYKDKPEITMSLLCSSISEASDVYLEIADSQDFITNQVVVELCNNLYYNKNAGKNKQRISRNYPGGARRLAEVLAQFDVNWDLHSIDLNRLLKMLPMEFDRFKSQ